MSSPPTTAATPVLTPSLPHTAGPLRLLRGRSAYDWAYAAAVLAGLVVAFMRYGASMDAYEEGILVATAPALIALGWFWGPLRTLALAVSGASLAAIALYARKTDGFGADLSQADQVFWLKYMLSSQSAVLWMCVLFAMSTAFYWLGIFVRTPQATASRIGSTLAWGGVFMALVGTMVRWYESHQIAPDVGHIPVSNLYEVFVLFCWLTTLFYLHYEAKFAQHAGVRSLGAFVMLVVTAAVGFLLWYRIEREAQQIQPLLPALQSWWMKIHVPANFVGYGTFSLAAMVALAMLLKTAATRALLIGLGGGVLPPLFASWGVRMHSAEVDQEVSDVARDWFSFDPRRFTVTVGDGRQLLAASPETWDYVVLDAFAGEAVPIHLLTEEMVALIDQRLAKHGLLVLNYLGYREGERARPLRSVVRTIETRFPNVVVYPSFPPGDYGNNIVLASREPIRLRHGPRPFAIPPWMEPQVVIQDPIDTSGSAIVLSDDYNPLDLWAVDASETWRKAAMDMWPRDVLFAE